MARDNNGDFTLYPGTGNQDGNPVVTGDLITADWANGTMTDMATSMTDSLDRNGRGGMLQPLRGIDGANGAPAYSYTNHPQTGRYVDGSGRMVDTVTGTDILRLSTSGIEEFRDGVWRVLSAPTATDVEYSNTTSGLSATNVQTAIDELKAADVTDYVDLSTNQTIGGNKDFTAIVQLAGTAYLAGRSGDHLISESVGGATKVGAYGNDVIVGSSTFDDMKIATSDSNVATVLNTENAQSHLQAMINEAAHPIGSIFITSSTEHPDTTFPGQTWVADAEGLAILGVGTYSDGVGGPETITLDLVGGTYTHPLTEEEMPRHNHSVGVEDTGANDGSNRGGIKSYPNDSAATSSYTGGAGTAQEASNGVPHGNVQPFVGRHIWRRTA